MKRQPILQMLRGKESSLTINDLNLLHQMGFTTTHKNGLVIIKRGK